MSATHDVTNQAAPLVDLNLFSINRPLQDALRWHHPGFDAARFEALGAEAGSADMQAHARLANTHAPELRSHDRFGHRIDQVEFHPSYHALLGSALKHRLHGSPWAEGSGSHVERAAAFMLFTEAEPSVLCPVSMSYAVTPALRANTGVWADWGSKIASPQYDPRFLPVAQKSAVTLGMGMTEKQGGSDVRTNTTRAEPDGDDAWGRRFAITGHKWFFSAPMCDAFLVLAQTAAGLSCFFLPRLRPDGSVNAIAVQRLKHKLGNHANASSEVEFDAATGWLVGDEGRGVPQILAMGALTRLDCALGTAGLMRQALSLALHHTAQRRAFGQRLIDQPMMKNVLADLALESEAATALAMRLARAVDRTEHGQDAGGLEAVMRRVLTPIAKFWVCKRGSGFGQEAMECLGGNGYVEEQGEGVMARIYREMPLNSIWEGAANIQALDLLRALRTGPVADALMHETAALRGAYPAARRLGEQVHQGLDGATGEAQARRLARDVALLVQAALLHATSPEAVTAAFVAGRIEEPSDAYGTLPAGTDLDAVLARAMPLETLMNDLILHHYAGSPFAEKLRLILGFKQLPWTSVLQPVIMPKPDLVALTGGYRRIPVLQVGADVYCDTALIARVLEQRQPTPTLFPASAPLAPLLAQWADSTLFWTAIPFTLRPETMGEVLGDARPEVMKAFGADRASFTAGFKRPSARDAAVLIPPYLSALNAQLADGRAWLFGDQASIADFSVAHALWFIRRAPSLGPVFDPVPALSAWLTRMLAIGHGTPGRMGSDQAVELAAACTGHAPTAVLPGKGFAAGQAVSVAASDYGADPVAGTLVGLNADEVVLRRTDDRAGTVHVHFPRFGYQVKEAA